MPPEILSSTISVPLECRYLLGIPEKIPPSPLVAITLHGYGSDPESMLRLTSALLGPEIVIASIQAPHQQYLNMPPNRDDRIGYNWGTPRHFPAAVALHHAILGTVIAEVRASFATPAERIVLVGFSQPVSMNYRFAGTQVGQVGGVIGLCGGVPGDWETGAYQPFTTPILHIARSEDEAYPVEKASTFAERLRKHASDVEFHMFPGQHRFPSKAGPIVEPWTRRVFGK
jgi:predicted esterase